MAVLAAGGALAYSQYRLRQIHRIDFGANGGGALTPVPADGVMNVLLVGSDTRKNISGAETKKFGTNADACQCSDTIMVLHVDPTSSRASLLSIPRDLWVPISGTNSSNRINSAFSSSADGPQRLVKTVRAALGIDVNHYMEVDFVGFRKIVDAVGGVDIPFPTPARDAFSGLRIAQAGCVRLDGDQALSYVRSRHYEYYENGRWRADGSSDFGRITRQQDFMRRVMSKAISQGARNPVTLNSLIDSGVHNLTIDRGLSAGTLARLALRFRSLDPAGLAMSTLPTRPGKVGGADILYLQQPEADTVLTAFRGRPEATPAGVAPSSVRVQVLNASGVGNVAAKVAGSLRGAGFTVAGTGNATATRASVIRYGPGQDDKAKVVAASLSRSVPMAADPALTGADVTLVIGSADASLAVRSLPAAGTASSAPAAGVTTAPSTTASPTPGGGSAKAAAPPGC